EEKQEESEKEFERPHVNEKEIEVWTLTEEKPAEEISDSNETSEEENIIDRISSEKENKEFAHDERKSSELGGKLSDKQSVCEPIADEKKDTKNTQESQDNNVNEITELPPNSSQMSADYKASEDLMEMQNDGQFTSTSETNC
ncbi:hypothetical protein ACTXT7_011823, partial [Hymenolepis weldensis]